MGYCMDQHGSKFCIKEQNIAKAMKAIKALHGKGDSSDEGRFAWVDEDFDTKKTLSEILECWRWQIKSPSMDVEGIEFIGEKLGDDLILFEAIAPYVKKGSYIEMAGEDGARWKWVFDGKTCSEKRGRTVYDEE